MSDERTRSRTVGGEHKGTLLSVRGGDAEGAKLAGVGRGSVARVEAEAAVSQVDNEAERARRRIGRPSKAEPFRSVVVTLLGKEPDLLSLEVLRRAGMGGYGGGKSAFLELVHSIRPTR